MLRDFVLELVAAPGSGATITLPGVAPTGRVTWASAFVTSQQFVFYVLDNSLMQEWGVGQLVVGSPSTIIRPTVVLGNSAGTTARLNFASTTRCYSSLPAQSILSSTNNAIGRNLLHNGRFDVAQRGLGPWTATAVVYGADRWFHNSLHTNGSYSDTLQSFSDANRAVIGDEQANRALNSVVVGGTAAGDFDLIGQRVESVRTLAGKTATLSFWAFSSVAGAKVAFEATQIFGTGGSPSAVVTGIGKVALSLTAGFVRYSIPVTFPSASGKTFGTNGDDYSEILLWLSAGSTYSGSRASSIGVQSATFTFWGFQLELGNTPTPLDWRPIGLELELCKRFYQALTVNAYGYSVAGALEVQSYMFPVQFRAAPTLVGSPTYTNCSGLALTAVGSSVVQVNCSPTATGQWGLALALTASADL